MNSTKRIIHFLWIVFDYYIDENAKMVDYRRFTAKFNGSSYCYLADPNGNLLNSPAADHFFTNLTSELYLGLEYPMDLNLAELWCKESCSELSIEKSYKYPRYLHKSQKSADVYVIEGNFLYDREFVKTTHSVLSVKRLEPKIITPQQFIELFADTNIPEILKNESHELIVEDSKSFDKRRLDDSSDILVSDWLGWSRFCIYNNEIPKKSSKIVSNHFFYFLAFLMIPVFASGLKAILSLCFRLRSTYIIPLN